MSEKAIFVTGAARGIGRATARRFVRGGWRVGLFDVDEDGVRALADELGPERCHAARLDVTDGAAASEMLERFARGSGGRLDVLFNNAGLLFTGPFEEISAEQNAAMIAVNLTGLVNLTRAAFPWLRDTPDARVVSMSSASSTYGVPELAVYSATKHAVRAFTEALELEWAPHGIRVCDVVPPYVDTPMISGARRVRSMETLGVGLTPEEVAGTVWEAAHGEGLHWPVGRSYGVLHALQGVTPPALTRRLVKRFTGY